MVTLGAYDDAVSAIYAHRFGRGSLAGALSGLQRFMGAASAGLSVYNRAGVRITHSLFVPDDHRSVPAAPEAAKLFDDPGCKIITERRLAQAMRFTDIVPENRLRMSRWFRSQVTINGLGLGLAIDLDLGGVRARLYVLKTVGERDFDGDQVEMFERISRHFEAALRGAADVLRPASDQHGCCALVFHEEDLAARPALKTVNQSVAGILTTAESRVASLLATGISRTAAAEILGVRANTLNTHMRRIYAKLNVRRSSEFVIRMNALPDIHPRQGA